VFVQEITEPGTFEFIPIETASPLQSVGEAKVVIKRGIGLTVIVPDVATLAQFEPVV